MCDLFSHEQLPVTGQQDTLFFSRDSCKGEIIIVIAIQGIETEHAEVGSEAAEVGIKDKACNA